MENSFIQFDNVRKIYKSGETEITALHDVNFSINRGEMCVIVGQSGAGKTTLLNILGGMDTLTDGKVYLNNLEVSLLKGKDLERYRRKQIGFVFQFYNLIQNLTAKENVELAISLCDSKLNAKDELIKVGLGGRIDNFPSQLSGGECRTHSDYQ